MLAPLKSLLVGFVIVAFQWLVLGRLTIFGASADAVLLYVAWMGLNHGRRFGSMTGFVVGLMLDAIYDTWGMHMILKTIVGFALGLLPSDEYEDLVVLPRQALLGGFAIAFLHNGLQVVFVAIQAGTTSTSITLTMWLGSAVYTALVGTLAALFAMR